MDGISCMVAENILFKSLDEKQHQIVLDAMFPKEFAPGDTIIKQGDDGDNFYILESGVCEVYKDGDLVQTVRCLFLSFVSGAFLAASYTDWWFCS